MPPRRLNYKIRTANPLTRKQLFSVPLVGVLTGVNKSYRTYFPAGELHVCAELVYEGYAIDFVQGRNASEDLLQGRFSQAF